MEVIESLKERITIADQNLEKLEKDKGDMTDEKKKALHKARIAATALRIELQIERSRLTKHSNLRF